MATTVEDITGTYQLLAKLGEGGMGAIYRVRHRSLDQQRVLKVMRPQLEADEDFQTRFLREAQLAERMTHENIAQLFDYAVAPSGIAYMVIEFIDGLTLEQVLKSSGPPSVGLCLEIARQALEALAYLHASGFIHRDISPDNLMLTRESGGGLHLDLIDLGIAKRVEEPTALKLTRTGAFVGKVRYASPEQFGGEVRVDYRSDLYSFGIVLYEMLTGRFPIPGDDTSALIAGHLFRPPLPFSESDPEGRVPEDLQAVVARALEKDRDDRFASAEELGEALAAIQPRFSIAQDEVAQLVTRGREAFPPVADQSTEAGKEALWQLLEKGPANGETAVVEPPRAGGGPGARAGRRLRRGWMVAALAAVVALAVGVGALSQRWAAPAAGVEETGGGQVLAPITEPISFGRFFALVIGNDDYRDGLQPLKTAVSDAQAVADLLEYEYGFAVEMLANATYTDILSAVEKYRFELTGEDNLLIYYAGHGRVEGETGYWLPVDAAEDNTANWVSNRDVSATLFDVPARHVLVIADSCYSGTLAGGSAIGRSSTATSEEERLRYIREMLPKKARLALTSGGEAPVLDSGSGAHSVFANAFLAILGENDDVIETSRLHALLQERIAAAVEKLASEAEPGYRQDPEYAPIPSAGHDGGEFFFAPSRLQASQGSPPTPSGTRG